VSLGVMSYHVRRLHALGFLELVKRTPRRGAIEHHYRAKARPHVTDEGWAETPAIVKRAMIGASLQQMSGYVNAAAARGGFDRSDAHISRSAITLDEQGWTELSADFAKLLEKIDRVEQQSLERLASAGPDEQREAKRVGTILMMFDAEGVPESHREQDQQAAHLGRRSSRRPQPLHAANGSDAD